MVLQGFFMARPPTGVLASTAGYYWWVPPPVLSSGPSRYFLLLGASLDPSQGWSFSNPKEASSPDGDASKFTVKKIALI